MSEFKSMQLQKKLILEKERTALLAPYLEKIAELEERCEHYEKIVSLHEDIKEKLKILVGTYYAMLAASYYQDCLEGYYDDDEEYFDDGD